jgi:hypothetical protein
VRAPLTLIGASFNKLAFSGDLAEPSTPYAGGVRLRREGADPAETNLPGSAILPLAVITVRDVALEPYAHEIARLRRRRDAARAPQCRLETQ